MRKSLTTFDFHKQKNDRINFMYCLWYVLTFYNECVFLKFFPESIKKKHLRERERNTDKVSMSVYVCGGSREGFTYIVKPLITFNTLVWFHITAFIVLIYESLITFG